jgi:hypothetical protein
MLQSLGRGVAFVEREVLCRQPVRVHKDDLRTKRETAGSRSPLQNVQPRI